MLLVRGLLGELISYGFSPGVIPQTLYLMETIIVSSDILIGIVVGGSALAFQVVLVLCFRRIINRIDRKAGVPSHEKPKIEIQ